MKLLDLLEISTILTTDIIIMLMLKKTSKKFQKIIGNGQKVDICFKNLIFSYILMIFLKLLKILAKTLLLIN